ncbi:rolling circle replication-associated protein [Metabacillus elymi]|uniref:Replication-associated protein ORF2/G2P domain-containing protein n=1 Tax=Metabacillus elymi TaxID=2745198 RepID=A0ABX6S374_9BACI|nr:hypothetical protein [Metabacillus sp. KUDC1714]QNF28524.1 hypothetical protein HUW50_14175 [Metabacillus sp. KUDC1714]
MPGYTKVIISNKLVEVIKQEYLPLDRRTYSGGRKTYPIQSIEDHDTNVKRGINRARNQIRRLLECNFTDRYAFITLTFNPTEDIDVTNINICNRLFAKFKKRLAYYLKTNNLPDFKYLGVTEFQDENRQGTIHFHIVCNLTEVPVITIQKLWQYGCVHKALTTSESTENEKISFYLKKGIADPRLNGHKRYFHSHGLKKPITIEVMNLDEFYNYLIKCQPTLKHDDTYQSQVTGETKYEQYYLEDIKELIKYVQEL